MHPQTHATVRRLTERAQFGTTPAGDPVDQIELANANGIRLTGMPGFNDLLSTEQLWQVSLLVSHADQLPAAVQTILQKPPPPME